MSYSLVDDVVGDGSAAAADFNAMQLAVYGQDKYQASEKLSVTAGIRFDLPVYMTDPLLTPTSMIQLLPISKQKVMTWVVRRQDRCQVPACCSAQGLDSTMT